MASFVQTSVGATWCRKLSANKFRFFFKAAVCWLVGVPVKYGSRLEAGDESGRGRAWRLRGSEVAVRGNKEDRRQSVQTGCFRRDCLAP